MAVAGRYVDGRMSPSGAQMVNAGLRMRTHNARFAERTGAVRVVAQRGVPAGTELFMGYGSEYWREYRRNMLAGVRPEDTVGGFVAYARELRQRPDPLRRGQLCEAKGVFVEELASTPAVRGRGLCTGRRLLQRMDELLENGDVPVVCL